MRRRKLFAPAAGASAVGCGRDFPGVPFVRRPLRDGPFSAASLGRPMNTTLKYATPEGRATPRFLPALIVAVAGCPVASVATALVGVRLGLNTEGIPPGDFPGTVAFGLIGGVFGGLVVAALSWAWRPRGMAVSIVGSLVVSAAIGVLAFLLGGG